jgi:ketosteroid isomerase-like protein
MDTEATRALIQRYYEVLPKGNKDLIAELLSEDCVWYPPASAPLEVVRGRDAVAQTFAGDIVKTTFDLKQPFALDVRKTVVDGDTAVVQQRITATTKAGNAYDNQYCWVYTCRDGKIAQMEEYADTVIASRAMGWE